MVPSRDRVCSAQTLEQLMAASEIVWGRLRLQAMPTRASTEHSRASLRSPLSQEDESEVSSEEPNSPIVPRNLFGADSVDGASDSTHISQEGSLDGEDAASGSQAAISAEGYANDTYSFVYRSAIFGLPLTIPASTLSP